MGIVQQTIPEGSVQFSSSRKSDFNFSKMSIAASANDLGSVDPGAAAIRKAEDKNDKMFQKARELQRKTLTVDILHKILPVAAFTRLAESSETCVSLTTKKERCRIKLRNPTEGAPDILEALVSLDIRKDWGMIFPNLMRVVDMSLCRRPHGKTAKEELLALDGRMIMWADGRNSGAVDASKDGTMALLVPWFECI